MKAVKVRGSENDEINRLGEDVRLAIEPLLQSEIVNGVLLKNVQLVAARTNSIDHKLGRILRGWAVVRRRADSSVWDEQDGNRFENRTLLLRCSADVVVDLWVF